MIVVDKFAVGDKVKLSEQYAYSYSPKWVESVKDKLATVLSVSQKPVKLKSLDKDKDLPMWRGRYGMQQEYTIFELRVQFEGTKDVYIVSQFGVDPA